MYRADIESISRGNQRTAEERSALSKPGYGISVIENGERIIASVPDKTETHDKVKRFLLKMLDMIYQKCFSKDFGTRICAVTDKWFYGGDVFLTSDGKEQDRTQDVGGEIE